MFQQLTQAKVLTTTFTHSLLIRSQSLYWGQLLGCHDDMRLFVRDSRSQSTAAYPTPRNNMAPSLKSWIFSKHSFAGTSSHVTYSGCFNDGVSISWLWSVDKWVVVVPSGLAGPNNKCYCMQVLPIPKISQNTKYSDVPQGFPQFLQTNTNTVP